MICAISRAQSVIPLKSAAERVRIPLGIDPAEIIELRLRAGRQAVLITRPHRLTVCSGILTQSDIDECFREVCRYSVHSYENEIREGYITLEGGHRVGICGTAVVRGGKIEALRDISSLNIRIAHEVRGCAEELFGSVFSGGICSCIIGGAPLSGKTTMLRDLTRLIGREHTTALIDSRGEISASERGVPTLDVGLNTDVLCGCPKAEGIMLAIRTLSPEVIVCDEISGEEQAVEQCIQSGVKLIAAAHAGSMTELLNKPRLAAVNAYADCAVFLGGIGKTLFVKRLRGD